MYAENVMRHARFVMVTVLGILASGLMVVGVGVSPARASTPYIAWSSFLPGWTNAYVPSSSNACASGAPKCLDATRLELGRIMTETARSCSHDAVFALAYARITQTYAWSRDIPGYYDDVPYINHMDAVFAKYYTDAYYAYRRGSRRAVPQSWLTAFDAARHKRVTGVGDLMLGMNAHINRDLPFVLAESGLVRPDGVSGKADYDKVEQFLSDASTAMMAEATARFDPTLDDIDDPFGAAYGTIFQIISVGRENAWRNAEALVSAPTPAARAVVARTIESEANALARSIVLAQSYVPLVSSTTTRDAHCAVHKGDAAPRAYPFGTSAPYRS